MRPAEENALDVLLSLIIWGGILGFLVWFVANVIKWGMGW